MSGRAGRDIEKPEDGAGSTAPAAAQSREQPSARPATALEQRVRLIRGFSHDVKNPLGAADGYAQMLEDGMYGPLNEDQQRSVNRIRRSLHAALELIDELAELTRAEAGQLEVRREALDVREIVREVVEENQARAVSAGLTLTLHEPPTDMIADTDAGRVRRILSNLISNAIKFTEHGGVRVTLGCADREQTGMRCIVVDVADTGPGIALEDRERVFEEFARVGERANGAGLGLAISRHVARALAGEITVLNTQDGGATFRLWLPAAG